MGSDVELGLIDHPGTGSSCNLTHGRGFRVSELVGFQIHFYFDSASAVFLREEKRHVRHDHAWWMYMEDW
jgi:hypothetical protein